MTTSWIGRSKQVAAVLALVLSGWLAGSAHTYLRDFHAAVTRSYQVVVWLSTPVAKLPDGTTLVRAQLIEAVLEREAAALNAQWLQKKSVN